MRQAFDSVNTAEQPFFPIFPQWAKKDPILKKYCETQVAAGLAAWNEILPEEL
jgi:hypothetical protein